MPDVPDSRKEARRRSIISASLKLFARNGYETTALDEVAREARLAKGTLYLYFKHKEDLYLQVLFSVLDSLEASIEEQAAGCEDPLQKMAAVARAQIGFFCRNRDYFHLFTAIFTPGMAGLHRKLFQQLQERRRRLAEFLGGLVEQAKQKKLVRGDIDTSEVVFSYIGMVNEAVQSICLPAAAGSACPAGTAAQQKTDVILKILFEGISVRSQGGKGP